MNLVTTLLVIYLVIGIIGWGASCVWLVYFTISSNRKISDDLERSKKSIKDMD